MGHGPKRPLHARRIVPRVHELSQPHRRVPAGRGVPGVWRGAPEPRGPAGVVPASVFRSTDARTSRGTHATVMLVQRLKIPKRGLPVELRREPRVPVRATQRGPRVPTHESRTATASAPPPRPRHTLPQPIRALGPPAPQALARSSLARVRADGAARSARQPHGPIVLFSTVPLRAATVRIACAPHSPTAPRNSRFPIGKPGVSAFA
jgi:hypothetical protein